ncbi:MAG: aminofutalosine synthase MqnE [Proteobacteria bacterium]|nr:aminofutalosine synthase MqnE [Pseudomonadota bacterium]
MASIDLRDITQKVIQGERLSRDDGLALMCSRDLLAMGEAAHAVKQRTTGDRVFFNVNCHINLTNICVSRCKFCAFSCDREDTRAYTMTVEEVLEKARMAIPSGITELHIVSGLHPDLPFSYYVNVIQTLRDEFPDIHIQAFTAVEIKYFSDISGFSVEEVLARLKEAGLGSLPGGGAEVFSTRIREDLCPKKASAEQWLAVMRCAHRTGLSSNATMLYGHIETDEEVIDHLLKLRALQDETGGFQSFIPLPFHPRNTQMDTLRKPQAYKELKMYAVSRLMLDNFSHIKAFWIMVGLKIAQLSLLFGVDDLDGTVTEEKITHAAGADTDTAIPKTALIGMIKESGNIPVERDTLYKVIRVYN